MAITGKCYCGALEYKAEGDPMMKAQCHCRECQYYSGGLANVIAGMSSEGFSYTKGGPKSFTRTDIESAVTREFCGECGTNILAHVPSMPQMVFLKVGTLDNPSVYGMPDIAIHTLDKQVFHAIPDGVPAVERLPG